MRFYLGILFLFNSLFFNLAKASSEDLIPIESQCFTKPPIDESLIQRVGLELEKSVLTGSRKYILYDKTSNNSCFQNMPVDTSEIFPWSNSLQQIMLNVTSSLKKNADIVQFQYMANVPRVGTTTIKDDPLRFYGEKAFLIDRRFFLARSVVNVDLNQSHIEVREFGNEGSPNIIFNNLDQTPLIHNAVYLNYPKLLHQSYLLLAPASGPYSNSIVFVKKPEDYYILDDLEIEGTPVKLKSKNKQTNFYLFFDHQNIYVIVIKTGYAGFITTYKISKDEPKLDLLWERNALFQGEISHFSSGEGVLYIRTLNHQDVDSSFPISISTGETLPENFQLDLQKANPLVSHVYNINHNVPLSSHFSNCQSFLSSNEL